MPIFLVENDITKLKVDAIVNAANSSLQTGEVVCETIFRAAGEKQLQAACNVLGHCTVGKSVIADGFNLPAT